MRPSGIGHTLLLVAFLTVVIVPVGAAAQPEATPIPGLAIADSLHLQILTSTDGSTNIGRILQIGDKEVIFETDLGRMTIPLLKIVSVKTVPVASIQGGQYWFPNPNSTRLFFAPTARMLGKGNGYFADYYLFFPGIAYGLTDNVNIGGGVSLFPGISPEEQLLFFTPKVGGSLSSEVDLAVGALVIRVPEDDNPIVGILYGVGTFGGEEGSITAGFGYGFADGEVVNKPFAMIGGEMRFARRCAFVTENWIFPEVDRPLISYGVRLFGESMSVDLALLNTTGDDMIFPGIPYVDFVFNF